MRFLGAVLVSLLFSSALWGQHDLSFWARRFDDSTALTPWYLYSGQPLALDVRYNFDQPKAVAFFAGKNFPVKKANLIPLVGVVTSNDYNAVSPEVYIIFEKGKFDFWSLNQYSRGIEGSPNAIYNWLDVKYGINRWLAVGVGEQFFKKYESGAGGQLDLGPSFGITHGGIYAVIWPTVSLGPDNKGKSSLVAGVGYIIWSKP